jgi:hypothetical protein
LRHAGCRFRNGKIDTFKPKMTKCIVFGMAVSKSTTLQSLLPTHRRRLEPLEPRTTSPTANGSRNKCPAIRKSWLDFLRVRHFHLAEGII